MRIDYLIIGGHHDGKRVDLIGSPPPLIKLAVEREVGEFKPDNLQTYKVEIEECVYYAEKIRSGNKEYTVYLHKDIPGCQLIEKMIKGYRQPSGARNE